VTSNLPASRTSGLGTKPGSRPKFMKGYAIRVVKMNLGFKSDPSVIKEISMNVSTAYDLLVDKHLLRKHDNHFAFHSVLCPVMTHDTQPNCLAHVVLSSNFVFRHTSMVVWVDILVFSLSLAYFVLSCDEFSCPWRFCSRNMPDHNSVLSRLEVASSFLTTFTTFAFGM
jgi:hypothetical protein